MKQVYNNMLANCLPLHTPLTPGVEQTFIFLFSESSHMHIKLTGMKHRTPCKQIFCRFAQPQPLGVGSKGQNIFFF